MFVPFAFLFVFFVYSCLEYNCEKLRRGQRCFLRS